MMTGEKILVAVDESACSRKAFELVLNKYKESDYEKVTAMNVVEGLSYEDVSDEAIRKEIEAAEKLLENYSNQAKEQGIEIETMVDKCDCASDCIVEFAEENDYDLIVIGSHGKSEMKAARLGSVSTSVAKDSNIPVLISK